MSHVRGPKPAALAMATPCRGRTAVPQRAWSLEEARK